MQIGRDRLTREMKKHGIGISSANSMRAIKTISEHMGYKSPDDMLVNIGTGKESPQHVGNRLLKLLVDDGNEESRAGALGSPRRAPGVMPPMITSVVSPKRREAHSSNGIGGEGRR